MFECTGILPDIVYLVYCYLIDIGLQESFLQVMCYFKNENFSRIS